MTRHTPNPSASPLAVLAVAAVCAASVMAFASFTACLDAALVHPTAVAAGASHAAAGRHNR